MSNLFTIDIPDSPAALLVTYGEGALIRVQSCPTEDGTFGDIPNPTQPILAGVTTYPVYDADGVPNDFYRFRYEAADGDPVGSFSLATQPVAETSVYASLALFKAYVRTESTDEDEILGLALASASRAIDRATNRTFSLALTDLEERYFTAERGIARIDDLMDPTGLIVSYDSAQDQTYSTTLDAADYYLAPIGALTHGKPYTHIYLRTGLSGGIKVSALWGWDAIPLGIQQACLLQASRIWARRNSPYGIAGSPELGNEIRLLSKLDPDVEMLVADYRRWWSAA